MWQWMLGLGIVLVILGIGALLIMVWRSDRRTASSLLEQRARQAVEDAEEDAAQSVVRATDDGAEAWAAIKEQRLQEVRDEAKRRSIADVFNLFRKDGKR